MHKYKLTLEYDGTRYSGWQSQKNAVSVQGKLIEAAKKIFPGEIEVQGAGRTDAGVHALAQAAHLAVQKKIPTQKVLYGLNDNLPHDICILSVEDAPQRFHARHHAIARSYIYLISKRKTAFGKKYVWWIKDELDIKRMKEAATVFVGFHDLQSFADKRMDKDASTKVAIESVELQEADELIIFRVAGSHFLWKMVRRMVGVLVEAGRGTLKVHEVEEMLQIFSDLPAKLTAPPLGLFLEQVLYENETWKKIHSPAFPCISSL